MNERDKREPKFTETQDLDYPNTDYPNTVEHTPRLRPVPVPANKNFLGDSLRRAVSEAEALANYYDNVAKQLSALADQVEQTK